MLSFDIHIEAFFHAKYLYVAICAIMVQILPYFHHRSHPSGIISWIRFLRDRACFKVPVYEFLCFYYKNKFGSSTSPH